MNIYESDYNGPYVYGRDYTGFVYLWFDRLSGMSYIGSHYGATDDGYIGSGIYFKYAYRKRPESFVRIIIEYVNDGDRSVRTAEQFWLDHIDDDDLGTKFYNLKKAAVGHTSESSGMASRRRVEEGTHHFLGSAVNAKRIENGTHPFIGGEIVRQRVEDGTHHLLGGEIQRNAQKKRVEDGTHPFLGEDYQRDHAKKRVEDGTHHFLDSEFQRNNQLKLVEEGSTTFLVARFNASGTEKQLQMEPTIC